MDKIEEDKVEFNEIKEGGLMVINVYKQTRRSLSNILFQLDLIFDTIEKMRKLMLWHDWEASKIALFMILIAFFIVSFVPLRFVICLWLINKFKDGSNYY